MLNTVLIDLQWIAVKGVVLDVTNWLDEHPGGPQALFSHMGKDASEGNPPLRSSYLHSH